MAKNIKTTNYGYCLNCNGPIDSVCQNGYNGESCRDCLTFFLSKRCDCGSIMLREFNPFDPFPPDEPEMIKYRCCNPNCPNN